MDALIEAINLSKTVHPGDIALLMDVDERALRYAVQLLTGMTLKDILHHWRVLQAKELWDAQCAGFKNYKEFAKEKSKDAPEGFLLSREVVDQYKNDVSINVRQVKLIVLITVCVLIGVCVSISGTISFVGLVMPHIARMLVGPNHKRLLPASLFSGAIFLLLADLISRTILSPIELSIGVITSLVGAVAFVIIFYRTRKAR